MSAAPSGKRIDPGMYALFCSELDTHAGTLKKGLDALGTPPYSKEKMEPLIRAAHSVKGAARIIGLKAVADPAAGMETFFENVARGKATLNAERINAARKVEDLFRKLAKVTTADLDKTLSDNAPTLEMIGQTFSSESAPPAAPAANPAPQQPQASSLAGDASMLELFRIEAATHATVLETGLVTLETAAQTPEQIEPLMRAAHSIKGAARIVGLNKAVELAHAMEDLLVAAQHGKLRLVPESIDVLLQSDDIFKNLAQAPAQELDAWLQQKEQQVAHLTSTLRGILTGRPPPAATPPPPAPAESEPSRKAAKPPEQGAAVESSVMVTAENLNRLMGLAGECMVGARQLQIFGQDLRFLKNAQIKLSQSLDELQALIRHMEAGGHSEAFFPVLEAARQCRTLLAQHIESFDLYAMRWDTLSNRLYNEAVATRMRPFRDGVNWSPRMVRDLARKLGKNIRYSIVGESTRVDRDVLASLEAPLNHILQNACDHGIESPEERAAAGKPAQAEIQLSAFHKAGMLHITVKDDGRGIDAEVIRRKVVDQGRASTEMAAKMTEAELMDFLFLPGFSTAKALTDVSGRGVGLDVVLTMVQKVGGTVRVQSQLQRGTSFHLQLPLTLSVIRTLLVEISGEAYAFPLLRVDRVFVVPREQLETIENRQYFRFENRNIGLVPAFQPLALKAVPIPADQVSIVVISDRMNQYGVVVDRLIGEHTLVVRPLDRRLGKVPDISSTAIMDDGSPVLIVDVDDLVRSIDNLLSGGRIPKVMLAQKQDVRTKAKRILVVDDSITVREAERKILQKSGYIVETAVDGMDGWNAVRQGEYDLVVSDVDMPRMNGIEMVKQIRKDPQTKGIPVVIVSYKDREEDRVSGLEAGANYYLTKSSFYDESFIKAISDLIGEP